MQPPERCRLSLPRACPHEQHRRVSPRDDLLREAAHHQPAGAAPAVSAHDHEVRGKLLRVLRDGAGHILHRGLVHVRLHPQAGEHLRPRDLGEVGGSLLPRPEVALAMRPRGGVALDDMHERQPGAESPRAERCRGESALGEAGSVQGDKEMPEHRITSRRKSARAGTG